MSIAINISWIFLAGGLFVFVIYLLWGLLLCCTIIGIPFGLQCMKLSLLGLFPLGKVVAKKDSSSGYFLNFMNAIWLVVAGIWIAMTHLVASILCSLTVIGTPFAIEHMKLLSFSLMPFGKEMKRPEGSSTSR